MQTKRFTVLGAKQEKINLRLFWKKRPLTAQKVSAKINTESQPTSDAA
jgi:hypothetical protein